MNKIIIGGAIFLLAVAAGVFVWKTLPSASKPTEQGVQTPSQQIATSTYATTTFSAVYQRDFTADDSHIYDQVNPKKPIHGVRFTIPLAMATGTNLASDTYLSVEQLPRAKNCTGDIYLAANVRPISLTENGINYSLATSSGAAAGNLYEEMVYALSGSSPCTAVRYFIHSTAAANYEPGAIREFDRAALLVAFDAIRASLTLSPTPAAPVTP